MAISKERVERLNKLKLFMLQHPEGVKLKAILDYMNEDRQMIRNDLESIGANDDGLPKGTYRYTPSKEEIEQAKAIVASLLLEPKTVK